MGVLQNRCSENFHQIYRNATMPDPSLTKFKVGVEAYNFIK